MQTPESREFAALEGLVSEKTLKGIADMGFTEMMEIQHKSIVPLLKGRSVVFLICHRTRGTDFSFEKHIRNHESVAKMHIVVCLSPMQ